MQLDAEEDENALYRPPVEPFARPAAGLSSEASVDSQAAATITAEDED
jgi:sorting nexin-1/2